MARKAIREYDAKRLMAKGLEQLSRGRFTCQARLALVTPESDLDELTRQEPWLNDTRLVVKPDQLFGKRGKNELILLDASWKDAQKWIAERMNKRVTIHQSGRDIEGELTHFLVEPFFKHDDEYYVAIVTEREEDRILFSEKGGVDIEEAWDSVLETRVNILDEIDAMAINLPAALKKKEIISDYIRDLYKFFCKYHLVYLEINPFTVVEDRVIPLDMVARVDDYASFQCAEIWDGLSFPKSFGQTATPEERRVAEIDARTGASLKLTVLNPEGRIWNLVAGGGASVIYADTVCDIGLSAELANYGEYSGDPNTEDTYEYTKVVLDLMTRKKDSNGRPKFLLIGGGVANFTNVATTFTGIIQAIRQKVDKLKEVDARILVRRGGPNYEEGLNSFRRLSAEIGIPIEVFGPETHMTQIVRMVEEA